MSERIYIRELPSRLICVDGLRLWFDQNNLDFTDFVRNGIEIEKLVDIDCEEMKKVLNERR